MNLTGDLANLEIHNNETLTRKVRRDIARIEQKELADLKSKVKDVRLEINLRKIKIKKNKEQ
jgi:hypothetical protein